VVENVWNQFSSQSRAVTEERKLFPAKAEHFLEHTLESTEHRGNKKIIMPIILFNKFGKIRLFQVVIEFLQGYGMNSNIRMKGVG